MSGSIERDRLEGYLDQILNSTVIRDSMYNGLQVEGKYTIKKIITGVSASLALIEAAIAANADAIITHHGYFWHKDEPAVTGILKQRLKLLLSSELNLFSYHLPLDLHASLGNNVQLANILEFEITGKLFSNAHDIPGNVGKTMLPLKAEELIERIKNRLHFNPIYIPGKKEVINTVAWCTGAGQKLLQHAILHKIDAYITGEISESTVHIAQEAGVHFFAAGHHATERYGIMALGKHLAERFDIAHEFIDLPGPA